MGTRNLTMVVKNQETKIAQYGQWDGYPAGQGITVLQFLKNKKRIKKLFKAVDNCVFLKDEEIEKRWIKEGNDNSFEAKYPQLCRDMAANVLQFIIDCKGCELKNSEDFAGDSLFCEWAYVIDLDKNTLEVYKGFNKEVLGADERFTLTKTRDGEYSQIKLFKTYNLDELPTKKAFVEELEDYDDDE